MATKKSTTTCDNKYSNIPQKLEPSNFFGIKPDDSQQALIDSVWRKEKKVYLVNSIAGSGKTLISTALGVLMVKYGIFKKMIYITFPGIYEKSQGFLPGDLLEKSEPYFQPLYDALIEIGELPGRVCNTSIESQKAGTSFIECTVSTYMRGINLSEAFIIIDESQNADLETLTKVLSRIHDDCLVMVIGHSGQCDMYDKSKSGFTACIDYQTKNNPDYCARFDLTENHRGSVSKWADLMLKEYTKPKHFFAYRTTNLVTGYSVYGIHKRSLNSEDIDDTWFLGNNLEKDIAKYGRKNFERIIIAEDNNPEKLEYELNILLAKLANFVEKIAENVE